MWPAARPLITLTILLATLLPIRVASTRAASQNAGSGVLSQLRLGPNSAGADESTDGNYRLIWTSRTGAAILYDLRTKRTTAMAQCVASDLRISADWQGVNTTKIGGVLFSTRGTSTCVIAGHPRLELYGDGRRLKVRQKPGAPLNNAQDKIERTVAVGPGRPVGVAFDWVNWCGRRFHSPIVVKVTIPGDHIHLSTYVRYGSVKRSNSTPACLAPSHPSTIDVGFIRSITPTTPLPLAWDARR